MRTKYRMTNFKIQISTDVIYHLFHYNRVACDRLNTKPGALNRTSADLGPPQTWGEICATARASLPQGKLKFLSSFLFLPVTVRFYTHLLLYSSSFFPNFSKRGSRIRRLHIMSWLNHELTVGHCLYYLSSLRLFAHL